jgi:hypothetical protein
MQGPTEDPVAWAREILARYDNYDIGAGDASNNAQDVD